MSEYGNQIPPKAGVQLFAKEGIRLNFYEFTLEDKLIIKQPDGGSKGQDHPPTRANGELVGTAVGMAIIKREGFDMVAVDWVNRWWRDGTIFPPQKGRWLENSYRGFVKLSEVTYEGLGYYENTAIVDTDPNQPKIDDRNLNPGIDTDTPGTTEKKFNWWWIVAAILIIRKL